MSSKDRPVKDKVIKPKIGILFMATGRYRDFVRAFHADFETYFLPEYEKIYYLFTDAENGVPTDITCFKIAHQRWPWITLKKFHRVLDRTHQFRQDKIDVLYVLDVDMRLVARVGEEVLPTASHPLVAATSPDLADENRYRLSYEHYSGSTAYVAVHEKAPYYVRGGFTGGAREPYLAALAQITTHIDKDLKKGFIAQWHDESYWNRYFLSHQTVFKVLGHEYCFPENFNPAGYCPKVIALTKAHAACRNYDALDRLFYALMGARRTSQWFRLMFMLSRGNVAAFAFHIRRMLTSRLHQILKLAVRKKAPL